MKTPTELSKPAFNAWFVLVLAFYPIVFFLEAQVWQVVVSMFLLVFAGVCALVAGDRYNNQK